VVGEVVGEAVGDVVVGEPVGEVVGDVVVGEPVGDEVAGDDVGDDVVGEPVGADVVGGDVGDEVVGDVVGDVVVGELVGEPVGAEVVGDDVAQTVGAQSVTTPPDSAAASSVASHTVPTNDPATMGLCAFATTMPLAQKSTDASAAAPWKAPRSTLVNADPNVTDASLTHAANVPACSLLTLLPDRSIDTSSEQ
jgi:hypothetical protein